MAELFANRGNPRPASGPSQPVRVGGAIKPPEILVHVKPTYPPIAQAARIQGSVTIEATIAKDGSVRDMKVLKSVAPSLDQAALDAVRQWKYTPTTLNGEPVEVLMSVTVNFTLQ